MDDENDNGKNNWLKQVFKALLTVVVVLVSLVVIGFGLLVGFCALGSLHK